MLTASVIYGNDTVSNRFFKFALDAFTVKLYNGFGYILLYAIINRG